VKDIVYHTKVSDLPDLHNGAVNAIASVPLEMLRNTWRETEYRSDVCCTTWVAHMGSTDHSKLGDFIHVS
jgi:hypothetical protein